MQAILKRAKPIELLALDVDGVLTDGRLYFGNNGEELKTFHIRDGLGIKLLRHAGIEVAIITGRQSAMVERRARELNLIHVIQARDDKLTALTELAQELALGFEQIAYMGDDLPDLAAIRRAGLGLSVADAHHEVARHADWQSQARGGQGAVREACELLLQAQGRWQTALDGYL